MTFAINRGSGFAMTLENGHTVSVQFGQHHYCSARDQEVPNDPDRARHASSTAEVAVIDPNGVFLKLPTNGEEVHGWLTPEEVVGMINWAVEKDGN
jgi:hypothetical protein